MNTIREVGRAKALANIPDGYRVIEDNEFVAEGDLYYIFDEFYQEDKGKAGTWQPINPVVDKKSGVIKSRGGDYFCAVRKRKFEDYVSSESSGSLESMQAKDSYVVLRSGNACELADEVAEYLAKGYRLQGGVSLIVFVLEDFSPNFYYAQALVKE